MGMSEILIQVSRGGWGESFHRGSIAVVDQGGTLLDHVGDPDFFTFLRSCAKPLQALPVIESGAADRFGLTPAELACMCGSLSGQDFHVAAVSSILAKIGLSEEELQCGIHVPSHRPTARKMGEEGEKPRTIHNNCAGKHAAMLALAIFNGWPTEGYARSDHPVQRLILGEISRMTEIPEGEIKIGIDGCGVPVFALPLRNLAWAYAKMAVAPDPERMTTVRQKALHRLMKAVLAHPEMIAGDQRPCTDLMRAAPGKLFAKIGMEGSYGLALMGRGIGIAVKMEDGAPRGLAPTVVEVLRQYGILQGEALGRLKPYGPRIDLCNFRKEKIGAVEPVFRMRNADCGMSGKGNGPLPICRRES